MDYLVALGTEARIKVNKRIYRVSYAKMPRRDPNWLGLAPLTMILQLEDPDVNIEEIPEEDRRIEIVIGGAMQLEDLKALRVMLSNSPGILSRQIGEVS